MISYFWGGDMDINILEGKEKIPVFSSNFPISEPTQYRGFSGSNDPDYRILLERLPEKLLSSVS